MNDQVLRVLVIDENQIRAAIIKSGLIEAGYSHVTVIHELMGMARHIELSAPDVIVIDLENPNRDLLETVFTLSRSVKRPIAMFVDKSDEGSIEAAVDAGVSAYVIDGLRKERVKPIMDLAISRFKAFSRLERELEDVRHQLEDRKVIEAAKGIIMKTKDVSEEEAYRILRNTAMNQNQRIYEIANSLVTASKLLEP